MLISSFTTIHQVYFSLDQHQPSGIFGSGFEEQISRRKKRNSEEQNDGMGSIHNDSSQTDEHVESGWELIEVVGDEGTFRGRVYNFIHLQTTGNSKLFDAFISTLVIGTSLTFMFDTVTASFVTPSVHMAFDVFELGSVIVFTIGEYFLVVISPLYAFRILVVSNTVY